MARIFQLLPSAAVFTLVLAITTLRPGAAHAQPQPKSRPLFRIDRLDTTKAPLLSAYVTDLDGSSRPVGDRDPKNYRLLVDGVPQSLPAKVRRFAELSEAVAVTFVVQVSPSLKPALTEVVESLKHLIDTLPLGSKVGVVAYTDVVVLDGKPGPVEEARRWVDDLRIRDDAIEVQLPDAVRDALEGLNNPRLPPGRLVIVISDGLSANLNYRVFSEIGRRARDRGVIVHSVGFAPLEPARLRTLYELSGRAGGTFREARDPESVSRAFTELSDQLLGQPVVIYRLPKLFDGKLHDLQIELPEGRATNIVASELPFFSAPAEETALAGSTWLVFLLVGGSIVGLTGAGLLALALRNRRRKRGSTLRGSGAPYEDDENEDEDEFDEREAEDLAGQDDEDEDEDEFDEREAEDDDTDQDARAQRTATPSAHRTPARRGGSSHRVASPRALVDPDAARRNIEELFTSDSPSSDFPQPGTPGTPSATPANGLAGALPFSAPGGTASPSGGLLPAPATMAPRPDTGLPLPYPGVGPALPLAQPPADNAPLHGTAGLGPAGGGLRLPDPSEYVQRQGTARPMHQGVKTAIADDASVIDRAGPSGRLPGPVAANQSPLLPTLPILPETPDQPRHGAKLDRKTAVLAIDETREIDCIGWIAIPDERGRLLTLTLRDGMTLGSAQGCEIKLSTGSVSPLHATIRVDSRGFTCETSGPDGQTLLQPLEDGTQLTLGDAAYPFKLATRFPQQAVAVARLQVLDGMDRGHSLALQNGLARVIGCDSGCDLVVRGDNVSDRHAVALRRERSCLIADLGSTGGLWVGAERVGQRELQPGEEVKLGTIRLIYAFDG